MAIEVATHFAARVTRHWPYATARIVGPLLRVEYANNDAVDMFHRDLAHDFGLPNADNKEAYEITNESTGTTLYLMFWDLILTVGSGVEAVGRDPSG